MELCGKNDVDRYFEFAGMSKKCFEAFGRFLTFVEKKKESYEVLVQQLKKAMPRKPRSDADTYIPSDEEILKLKSYVEKLSEPYYTTIIYY
jgi:intergrase/recombinase